MATTVVFQVPVHVEVDDRERRVLSVKVDDEAVVGPLDVLAVDEEVDVDRRQRAAATAERAEWPAWELGAT